MQVSYNGFSPTHTDLKKSLFYTTVKTQRFGSCLRNTLLWRLSRVVKPIQPKLFLRESDGSMRSRGEIALVLN